MNIVENARKFAKKHHGNQMYGGEFPYATHLQAVESVLLRFGVVDESLRACAWLHDVLEDTDATYDELELYFGSRIAKVVSLVTESKVGNRRQRHEHTYPKIILDEWAIIVKVGDRIANVESGGKLIDMYKKEYNFFKSSLFLPESCSTIKKMWTHLDGLLI